jgi:diadenosine tetraphosphate (Ap4A) HIT family hydrolase
MTDCSLCGITRGVIAGNEHWNLVLNENQATLGRVFFALKRHETDITRLSPDEVASLWEFVGQGKDALARLWSPDHYNYMFLMNLTPHAHFHIFPRYASAREFAGKTYADSRFGDHYDPAEERPVDDAAREALVAAIRGAL